MNTIFKNVLLGDILKNAPEVDFSPIAQAASEAEFAHMDFDKELFEPAYYTCGEGFGRITLGVPIIPSYALCEEEPLLRHLLGLGEYEIKEIVRHRAGVYRNERQKLVYCEREDSFAEDPERILITGGLAIEMMLTEAMDIGDYELLGVDEFDTRESLRLREDALKKCRDLSLTVSDFAPRCVPVLPKIMTLVKYRAAEFTESSLCMNTYRIWRRNERRKKILTKRPPFLVLNNEARMLQEACDYLYSNLGYREIYFSVKP